MMKYLVAALLMISTAWAAPLDRIVAVVNDEVVLESELQEMMQSTRAQLRQRQNAAPPTDVLRQQVLERLIMKRVQLQRAEEVGIRVGDDTLNAALQQIAQNNNMSLRQFRDALEDDGYNFTQFRESIREDMIISRLRKSQVEDSIVVSDREIEAFLETQQVEGDTDNSYRLAHILISLPEAADPSEVQAAKEKLEKVQSLLDEGADFSEVAAGYSDGQNALEGGDLDWRKQGELPTLFADVVPDLEVGEVSEPLRNGSGFHLIQLTDKRADESMVVNQTKASHILIKTDEVTTDEQARTRLQKLHDRIQNGEDFGELARAHSEDTGSAIDNGSLGWTSPGEMVPEFEEVMDALDEGEVSQVFQSRYGWHIIKVEDRRQENMEAEFKRKKARDQIRERKTQEELESWLRAMRDEAYVEYRDL